MFNSVYTLPVPGCPPSIKYDCVCDVFAVCLHVFYHCTTRRMNTAVIHMWEIQDQQAQEGKRKDRALKKIITRLSRDNSLHFPRCTDTILFRCSRCGEGGKTHQGNTIPELTGDQEEGFKILVNSCINKKHRRQRI